MNKKILIVDSFSLLYKAFYGVRPMHSSDGTPTNAVYGFVNMLIKIINEKEPDYVFASFDADKKTFRNELFADYKAGRQQMPEELREQIPIVQEFLKRAQISVLAQKGYEADDIIGRMSFLCENNGDDLTVVTGDRDSFQLAGKHVKILYARKGVSDTVEVTPEYIKETYGLSPRQLIDLKALMGDKSDNIPGVGGVGEKTALSLVQKYGSLDGVYENLSEIKGKLKEKLEADKDNAYLSRKLGEICRDFDFDADYETADDFDIHSKEVAELLSRYEMKNLLKTLGISAETEPEKVSKQSEVAFKESVPEFNDLKNSVWAVSFSGEDIYSSAISLSGEKENYFIKDPSFDFVKGLFEDANIKKTVHDFKPVYKKLMERNVEVKGIVFDVFVAAYVSNASDERYDLSFLAKKYLNEDIDNVLEQTQQTFFDIDAEINAKKEVAKANVILRLYNVLNQKLSENGESDLYYNIEHRLIFVLAEMERVGFKVDINALKELGAEFDSRSEKLHAEMMTLSGKDVSFNFNSTKQLGELLFDELGLPVVKKTKTGYSTDIEVLEKLKDKHPLIPLIIEQRQIAKLNSTYVKGLLKLADDECRIHSTFNQTITTTGRISSSSPNLQNIPVKTEEGRVIRKVFVPEKPGCLIVSADYSQIELRVLAHIADDENMINAFKNNIDIHAKTASEVFNVPVEEVTKEQRSRAKAVNFGIVYGISDFGLSKGINTSRKEAKDYIEAYFAKFPKVKEYMNNIAGFARENGYVSTLFGRRRYLNDINSKNYTMRSFAERTAFNTPIQGTAADIIKIAMVDVSDELKKRRLKSQLILQIHDELLIDCVPEEKDEIVELLKDKMENAVSLKVPLVADVNYGESWYDAK